MKRVLAGVALALTSMATPARADTPTCQYYAAPTVELGFDSSAQAGTNIPAVVEHWKVGCSSTCDVTQAIKFWDGIRLVYASEPTTELTGVDSLGPGQDTAVTGGDTVMASPLQGVKIVPIFKAGCGDGVNGTDLIEVTGQPLVVPPYLPPGDQINIFIDDPAFTGGLPIFPATQTPLNLKFHVRALIGATPKGSEGVTVKISGAGINFQKTYLASGGDIGEQLANDPAAKLQATAIDTITMSVTFEGQSSDVRQLTVVHYDSSGNPITSGSTSGGGTGTGGDGSTGSSASNNATSHKSGCSAAGPAGSLLSLLALAGLRRRRR